MPRQKLTPEIPNAQARTSVPTFIRRGGAQRTAITEFVGKQAVISLKDMLPYLNQSASSDGIGSI